MLTLPLPRLYLVVALTATLPGVGARAADEPESVAPITFGAAGASAKVAPAQVAPAEVEEVAPVGFNLSHTARDVALTQIKAGTQTLEDAWQSGALTYENLADLLENEPDVYVINYREGGDGLHHRLMALLLQHEGKRLQSLDKVSPRVRLWLANYYWTQNDAKAVEVAQSLLDEFPPPAVGPQMIAYQAIERIAWFYRDRGQHQQSADAWLRWKAYQDGPSWALINADLEAARELEKAGPGNAERVSQLRQAVVEQKDGWTTALVYYDEYRALMDAGQPEAARRALSQPLEAISSVAQGRIAQNTWLALIAYQAGDLGETLRLTQEALQLAQTPDFTDKASVKGLADQARELYNRAGGWKTQPIQTDTKEVVFQTNPSQPDRPLYARFRIKTYGDTSITASVDNPAFQARVLPIDNWRREGLNAHEQEREVVVTTSLNRPVADVPLVLSSAARGKTTTVRLSLREESPRPALSTGG